MRVLVTGVAGFIGSALAEQLVADGHDVLGVDGFTDFYPRRCKLENLTDLLDAPRFELLEADLRRVDHHELVDGCDVVVHLAAQAGVRASWSSGFLDYVEHNIWVTQQLLEAARRVTVDRLVLASSSSVYGQTPFELGGARRTPRPHSPYGVSKLAAEQLAVLYAENFGLPTTALRYFTVYGPRQRPDMAFHRIVGAALGGPPFEVFGSGEQRRDFTFVDDVVAATVAATTADLVPGTVLDVAGGVQASVLDALDAVGEIVGRPVPVTHRDAAPGDVRATVGDTGATHDALGWQPRTGLRAGLRAQVAWQRRAALAEAA